MRQRHLGALAERERRRRKYQQRRGTAGLRPSGDPRRLEAAVGPDAMDQRQPVADLAACDIEHAALLHEATSVECASIVTADRPSTAATSRKWLRKFGSSMEKSSWNGSSTAGITP